MGFIEKGAVLEILKTSASNSSHFVWLVGSFKYFQGKNGWTFAFQRVFGVHLFAAEPVHPHITWDSTFSENLFLQDWHELQIAEKINLCSFVLCGHNCTERMEKFSFVKAVRIGKDPWVQVSHAIPSGHLGHGVRSARNRAIKMGFTIEEVKGAQLNSAPAVLLQGIKDLYLNWKEARSYHMDGFLFATDPFLFQDERRYFFAKLGDVFAAYIVASPVYRTDSFYLEDIVISPKFKHTGIGELLVTESMVRLNNTGIKEASLGVVLFSNLSTTVFSGVPAALQRIARWIPRAARLVYNYEGLDLYRKRFKPSRYEDVYLCARQRSNKPVKTWQWLWLTSAAVIALKPRFKGFSFRLPKASLQVPPPPQYPSPQDFL